jgi:transcription antitermination factor NusG
MITAEEAKQITSEFNRVTWNVHLISEDIRQQAQRGGYYCIFFVDDCFKKEALELFKDQGFKVEVVNDEQWCVSWKNVETVSDTLVIKSGDRVEILSGPLAECKGYIKALSGSTNEGYKASVVIDNGPASMRPVEVHSIRLDNLQKIA